MTTQVVEYKDLLILIQDRRVIERVKVGQHSEVDWDKFYPPVPHYTSPTDPRRAGVCSLCGEGISRTDDMGEMHGAPRPYQGVHDVEVDSGLVHAQCGLDAGWEVS